MKAVKFILDDKCYKGKFIARARYFSGCSRINLFEDNGNLSLIVVCNERISDCKDNCEECEKRFVCYTNE